MLQTLCFYQQLNQLARFLVVQIVYCQQGDAASLTAIQPVVQPVKMLRGPCRA